MATVSIWAPLSQFASESITGTGFKFYEKIFFFHKIFHLTFFLLEKNSISHFQVLGARSLGFPIGDRKKFLSKFISISSRH